MFVNKKFKNPLKNLEKITKNNILEESSFMLSHLRKSPFSMRFFSPAIQNQGVLLKQVQLSNGETYAYREVGEGSKVLLMTHAALTSSYFFQNLFPALSKHFKIIAPDLRGSGHSTYLKPVNSIEDYVDDLKLFVDALNLKQINFFGWSLGGTIGMKFAAKYAQDLESLIIASAANFKGGPLYQTANGGLVKMPLLHREECYQHPFVQETHNRIVQKRREELREKFFKFCYHGICKPEPARMNQYIEEALLTRNAQEYIINKAFFNYSTEHNGVMQGTGEAYQIKAKTLIIHGTNDQVCDPSIAKELKNCIGRNAQLKLLSGAGHCVFEDFPEETIDAVKNFCYQKPIFNQETSRVSTA